MFREFPRRYCREPFSLRQAMTASLSSILVINPDDDDPEGFQAALLGRHNFSLFQGSIALLAASQLIARFRLRAHVIEVLHRVAKEHRGLTMGSAGVGLTVEPPLHRNDRVVRSLDAHEGLGQQRPGPIERNEICSAKLLPVRTRIPLFWTATSAIAGLPTMTVACGRGGAAPSRDRSPPWAPRSGGLGCGLSERRGKD